jgi:hypothetical protein
MASGYHCAMNHAPLRLALLAAVAAVGCNLPPLTVAHLPPSNGPGDARYPDLPAGIAKIEATRLADYRTKPICDVRSGKPVHDDKELPKVLAGVAEWQKLGKKSPPKPAAPVDPNQGPVSVDGKGLTVKIPGLSSGKKRTDQDPDWFAVACDGPKITLTVADETIELDALYAHESSNSPHLWIGGFSLKQKRVVTAKLVTKAPPPHVVIYSQFHAYDLSRYQTAKVEDVHVDVDQYGYNFYFVDEGKAAGLQVLAEPYGDNVNIGRFTVGAPPAK